MLQVLQRTVTAHRTAALCTGLVGRALSSASGKSPRVLVTGACGQVGTELVARMRQRYGVENVIASDVIRKPEAFPEGPFFHANVLEYSAMEKLVVEHQITWLVHLTGILSAAGEKNLQLAFDVNVNGAKNALDLAHRHSLRIFAPSSIAAFGPSTPRDPTPNDTIMRPSTIYGVSKVFLELLGEYYHTKFGVDFRSLRYPGIISPGLPGGGTTDYAIHIFYSALKEGKYNCFLREDSELPMMHMEDCLKSTIDFLEADASTLSHRTYNVTGTSFTPKQLAEEIKKHIPNFSITYEPDFRQAIADSWPKKLDDSLARKDWGWKHSFDLERMTKDMLDHLRPVLL